MGLSRISYPRRKHPCVGQSPSQPLLVREDPNNSCEGNYAWDCTSTKKPLCPLMVVWYTVTELYITLHSSPARLGGIHPVQIHLIGIRDSRDHRSVRDLGGGGTLHMKWLGMMLLRNFELNP